METFTSTNEALSKGIKVVKTEKLGWALILGEYGRGRWQEHVKLDSRRPASVESISEDGNIGVINAAGVVTFEANSRQRTAFTVPKIDDNRKLVHIQTGQVFMKNQSGKATAIFGRPRLIVSGWGAFGDTGNQGTWEDCLWTMKEGDAIFVRPSGGQNTEAYVVFNNGTTLVRYSPEDFKLYVIKPWLTSATETQIRSELHSAEIRKDIKMVELFNTALANVPKVDTTVAITDTVLVTEAFSVVSRQN